MKSKIINEEALKNKSLTPKRPLRHHGVAKVGNQA